MTTDGWTPLHMAARFGYLPTVKTLIDKKVKIDLKNIDGETPLYGAVLEGYPEIARLLVDHGANVNTRTNSKVSILQAVSKGKKAWLAERNHTFPKQGQTFRDFYAVRKILVSHGAKE